MVNLCLVRSRLLSFLPKTFGHMPVARLLSVKPRAFSLQPGSLHSSRRSATIHRAAALSSNNGLRSSVEEDTNQSPSNTEGSSVKQKQQLRTPKRRLDEACLEQLPSTARNVVQSWIIQGKVVVNGKIITKPGTPVAGSANIDILAVEQQYVCRAGHKMEAALKRFNIDVTGLRCLDAGLSTGGFTDCLLQKGAVKVYGVDVGAGQVAERLRQDLRVVIIDRTNLRYLRLQDLPESAQPVDLISLDLSFISVLKVMEAVCDMLKPGGILIVLIKPQFEAGRTKVASGGVVRDPRVHKEVIETVTSGIVAEGFSAEGLMDSPIPGATSGNKEFLAWFKKL